MSEHRMEGRVAGGYDQAAKQFSMIVVCSCGHAFYGLGYAAADKKWADHAREESR